MQKKKNAKEIDLIHYLFTERVFVFIFFEGRMDGWVVVFLHSIE